MYLDARRGIQLYRLGINHGPQPRNSQSDSDSESYPYWLETTLSSSYPHFLKEYKSTSVHSSRPTTVRSWGAAGVRRVGRECVFEDRTANSSLACSLQLYNVTQLSSDSAPPSSHEVCVASLKNLPITMTTFLYPHYESRITSDADPVTVWLLWSATWWCCVWSAQEYLKWLHEALQRSLIRGGCGACYYIPRSSDASHTTHGNQNTL